MKRVVVIGAGVGGLTAAGVLARAGVEVTVLEAHVVPGGCASTYYYQGYRFEAGATLAAGFYPGGPMARVAQAVGVPGWDAQPANPAMVAILPGGQRITRWTDEHRWQEAAQQFGPAGVRFFRWQEATADLMWSLALRLPPWRPQSLRQVRKLGGLAVDWKQESWRRLRPSLAVDLVAPVATHLRGAPENLRLFVDGQLLISAQATSQHANALYGAAALDLPRRGVVHLRGGIGHIADQLVSAVRHSGGSVLYRQQATRIVMEDGRPVAVETRRGDSFPADLVIANLTPWDLARLLGDSDPPSLRRLPVQPKRGWGAFMLYVGFDGAILPAQADLHTQVIKETPLGEGNSVFLSLSPEWDTARAPAGQRAVTISTHTALAPWWELHAKDRDAYEARKQEYTRRVFDAAEIALPGLREAAKLVLPGTPVTFQRFTHRHLGWVGGFPQTSLFASFPPRMGEGLWLVGDSIFPGQSTAAVALGGLRVAQDVLDTLEGKA